MPTFILRPYMTTGDWIDFGSGSVADENDATYKYFTNLYQYGVANFDTTSLPWNANIAVKSLRVRARVRSSTSNGVYVRVVAGTGTTGRTLIFDGDGYQFYCYGASFAEQSTGERVSPFQPSDGDIVTTFHPTGGNPAIDSPEFSEIYLDVIAYYPPIPVASTPSGTYTTTSSPPFKFTYFSEDGLKQTAYRYIIYTSAQVAASGFIAGTTTPTYDSGVVLSTSNFGALHALPNGTYRVYFAVAQTVNGALQWSLWTNTNNTTYKDYTLNITPPAAPTVVATPDNTNARIILSVTGTGAANSVQDLYQLERSFDSGVTWEFVRSDFEGGFLENVGGARQWYDYETGNGQSVIYRARTITYDTIGNTLVGPYGSNSSATSWSSSSTWLKIVDRPDLNRTIVVRSFGTEKYDTNIGVFQGLDSEDVIVVTGTRRARPDGSIVLLAQTDTEQQLLRDILALGSPLLVQASSRSSDWKNENKYLEVGDVTVSRPTRAGWSELRDLSLPYSEITRPDPSVYLVEFGTRTWQDIDDQFSSFTVLNAAFASYGAIRQ